MPKKRATKGRGSKGGRAPRNIRRVSELEREVAVLNFDSGDEEKAANETLPEEKMTEQMDETDQSTKRLTRSAERMKTRQDANPERRRTLQRLMEAIRGGEFDAELSDSEDESEKPVAPEKTSKVTRQQKSKHNRKTRQRSLPSQDDSDSDYVQAMRDDGDEVDDEGSAQIRDELELEEEGSVDSNIDTNTPSLNSAAEKRLKSTEKRLVLKFRTANPGRTGGIQNGSSTSTTTRDSAVRLEDIDWSEFDLETINEILTRREALKKKRRNENGANNGGEITTAKLKKSSLAPPPLQLDTMNSNASGAHINDDEEEEEGAIIEDDNTASELYRGNEEVMEVDVEGEGPEFGYLFEDTSETMPQTPSASLHLPPRASAMSGEMFVTDEDQGNMEQLSRPGRPHPALIRNMTDRHTNVDKDMRLVLQYELKSEENLLKDMRAELMDKLFKLQTEERLLRMIVKGDFELPEDETAEDTGLGMDSSAFTGFETDMGPLQTTLGSLPQMEIDQSREDLVSESGDSLSGMSSSSNSSDDEVQDEEVTRGALSRVLDTYLPNGGLAGDPTTDY
ncbi:hypothetical protein COEREDRAFT_79422 [Coemansia reversa NRRL 1564]|uniref:Uncharacterized protein n=1 Tax=Coemansia reversa (strain ATCC 12441 / NRRL 1564) TaxID=763665 RepID=A0A2G5BJE7_COERN|nr:hypothetical protein COEREDRAFT_79422 [Coemansia reversa NRRL 1564]|eukprot:PIA18877.1 hypothetical protein COEREDRAFT_79422 [Coemansia reversa NRRL 1564]